MECLHVNGTNIAANTETRIAAFKNIQTYVLFTTCVLLLQLGHLIKPFAYGVFRLLSWISYLSVPTLIAYIIGLMAEPLRDDVDKDVVGALQYLTCVWVIFLMFVYTGFDNLNAFSLEEGHGRFKIVLQIGHQFGLFLLILYQLRGEKRLFPVICAFIVLTCKFVGRLVALAHSVGATPRMKKDVVRIIKYMNQNANADSANPVTMEGFKYLVGPKFSELEGKEEQEEEEELSVVEGVTLEKIWGTNGRLLKETNKQLKDTCLSFALFWLLLGKFLRYPLYSNTSSKAKAWKLVRYGLLAEEGDHERVFRVIEIELAFLRDYFHAKYIFFYLNGFYWKLISIVALPAMFWWFIKKSFDQQGFRNIQCYDQEGLSFTKIANTIVISVIVALEAMQLYIFLTSRWIKVSLYCLYAKKAVSEEAWRVTHIYLEFLGSIFLGSSRSSNGRWWRKPWKRELDQYSLVKSCTAVFKPSSYLKVHFSSIAGVPVSRSGRKLGEPVELSNQVKKAVIVCLQRNEAYPKLSNGSQSLERNGFSATDYMLNNDIETIVVWHIATSVCEFHRDTTGNSSTKGGAQSATNDNMKVAIDLSKYCAYLLFFSPSLLRFMALESEAICNAVIKEARKSFKKPFFSCWKGEKALMYENVMTLISDNDEEAGHRGRGMNLIRKGAFLGRRLVTKVGDEEERWKILAEFWAEMILYLAPSDNSQMAHAGKLSQGGEFITQLWALLIHAGIANKEDMNAAAWQKNDDAA